MLDCLWYGVFGPQPVQMILVRDRGTWPMLALITTDLSVTTADLVARYASRWAIEVTFFDTRQILGVGQAHNRTAADSRGQTRRGTDAVPGTPVYGVQRQPVRPRPCHPVHPTAYPGPGE